MKKIFAKELAALAVLALAFTGCNTAFDGTNANLSEKEAEYTDRSGATQSVLGVGSVSASGILNVTNKKNLITVTVNSFSKINLNSADEAIAFQRLTKNATNEGYYPTRGTVLPKTRIKTNESGNTTTIYYEVDASGVTEDRVAFFVDATKLKTKGGTPVLTLDGNVKRGEVSDSYIQYFTPSGQTATAVSTGSGVEDFAKKYSPIDATPSSWYLKTTDDATGKLTGVRRIGFTATNKVNTIIAGSADDYEAALKEKLDANVKLQYREPGNKEYKEENLVFTWHSDATASTATRTNPFGAHSYTADIKALPIGTEYRVVVIQPEGLKAPDWYEAAYGHPGIVCIPTSTSYMAGARTSVVTGTYTLHSSVPSYIVVNALAAQSGSDITSSYNPTEYDKAAIYNAQKTFFQTVTRTDNWIEVRTVTGIELDPTAAKDFIVVDANKKKIAADVDVITYSYNNSNTDSGKVEYVKITVKDVRYRDSTSGLTVLVGSGTKIKENKTYPAQLTFGQWKDVADDDASGYVKIN